MNESRNEGLHIVAEHPRRHGGPFDFRSKTCGRCRCGVHGVHEARAVVLSRGGKAISEERGGRETCRN